MKKYWLIAVLGLSACAYHPYSNQGDALEMLWQKSVNRGYSHHDYIIRPAVGSLVWVGDEYGNLGAYTKSMGDLVWRKTLPSAITAEISEDRGLLAVPLEHGRMMSFSSVTGETLWSVQLKGRLLTAPVITSTLVIVKTDTDHIYAVDKNTGRLVWHFHNDAPSLILYGASQPVIAGDAVIVGFSSGILAKFRLNDGKMLWSKQVSEVKGLTPVARMRDIIAQPVVVDNLVYWTSYQGHVGCYHVHDGGDVWQAAIGSYQGGVIHDDQYIVTTDHQKVIAFNRLDGELLWENNTFGSDDALSSPIVFHHQLLILNHGLRMHFLDLASGKERTNLWLGHEHQLMGLPKVLSDQLYAYTAAGELFVANPNG